MLLILTSIPAAGQPPTANRKPEPLTYDQEFNNGLKIFNERCKSSGITIKKSVKSEGIRLETVPSVRSFEEQVTDREWIFAGMPMERIGDKFIASFLDFYFSDNDLSPDFPGRSGFSVLMKGFEYVDAQQTNGTYKRYRLTGKSPSQGMTSEPVTHSELSRYSVSIEPLGSDEDRRNWVAGSHVKVTDSKTKQIIGELRSFSFALPPKKNGTDLQRRFWNIRMSCPKYLDIQDAMTRVFIIGIVDPRR